MKGIPRPMDSEGRITVPAALRKMFDIEPGDKFLWVIKDGDIAIERIPNKEDDADAKESYSQRRSV